MLGKKCIQCDNEAMDKRSYCSACNNVQRRAAWKKKKEGTQQRRRISQKGVDWTVLYKPWVTK